MTTLKKKDKKNILRVSALEGLRIEMGRLT